MGFLKKLFGWQQVKAGIHELEQELAASETPSLETAAKVLRKQLRREPVYVATWSWVFQEWITISGELPEGISPPPGNPLSQVFVWYDRAAPLES